MSKLLDFPKNRSSVFMKTKSETSAEMILYGAVGSDYFGDGITAKQISEQLKALPSTVKEISVRINSPGGDVFEGIAIYNRLKQHSAKVVCYVDGLAASIASVIMLAGDEVIIGEGALVMVHLPWTMAVGDRKQLDEVIDRLAGIEEQMISIYSKKTKLGRFELKKLLEAETWMSADEAIANGFANTKMAEDYPIAACIGDASRKWIKQLPKNLLTENELAKAKINELKSKIEGVIARKK